MHRFLLVPLVLLMLLALGSCQENTDSGVPAVVAGKDWYYTHQADGKDGLLMYKPLGTFTPVGGMGIDGFRLDPDGTFVLHTQGPADEVLDVPGTWRTEGTDTYRISLRNGQPSYLLTIKLIDDNTLRAHRDD